MPKEKTTKELAQRIDPTYFRRWHPLRLARRLLTWGGVTVAALWIAAAWASGNDALYMAGPVASGHALFEADCARCHEESFGPIHDASCLPCHLEGPHVPAEKGRDPACASCHAEHRGRETLHAVGDAHCNGCHEDHAGITAFFNHRDFRPRPQDQLLRFNHEKHLKPDLVEGPLDCASCHVPEAGNFRAIAFKEHCARCHSEPIDRKLSRETVPHGFQPAAIRDWVTAVYVRRTKNAPAAVARADAAADALFKAERGCLLCHVVQDGGILPPRVPASWMTRAVFRHDTHRTEICARCHDMRDNAKAETLGLPGAATCRECHRADGARTSCVTCHPYHPKGR